MAVRDRYVEGLSMQAYRALHNATHASAPWHEKPQPFTTALKNHTIPPSRNLQFFLPDFRAPSCMTGAPYPNLIVNAMLHKPKTRIDVSDLEQDCTMPAPKGKNSTSKEWKDPWTSLWPPSSAPSAGPSARISNKVLNALKKCEDRGVGFSFGLGPLA